MSLPLRVLGAAAFGAALLLVSTPAQACSCMFPPLEAAREDAAALFEGRVLEITDGKVDAGTGLREVKLAVVRSWKGLDKHEQVTLRTSAQSSLCGYAFAKGTSYLVYAAQDDGQLSVSACSRTRPIADAGEDLNALGAGATPVTIATKSAADAGAGVADAGGVDAGAQQPKPVKRSGGCASTRGQASLAPYLLALPALMWRRRRRRDEP